MKKRIKRQSDSFDSDLVSFKAPFSLGFLPSGAHEGAFKIKALAKSLCD